MPLRFWFLMVLLAATAAPARAGPYYLVSSMLQSNPQEAGLYRLADLCRLTRNTLAALRGSCAFLAAC